jgi:hypothetical protein
MYVRTGRPELPFPRNLVELTHKCFPAPLPEGQRDRTALSSSGGTLYIVDADDPELDRQILEMSDRVQDLHFHSGAYGARARRLVREGRIDVHHPFHSLENAILQVSVGNDYVLYTDTSLISLVGSELAKVERKVGLRTKVVYSAHMGGIPEGQANRGAAARGSF